MLIRIFLTITLLSALIFILPSRVSASLVTVTSKGTVTWKVLSAQDTLALGLPKKTDLEIKEIAGDLATTEVTLKRDEERVLLNDLDVTNFQEDLIEIEEREDTKKIFIGVKNGKFIIKQEGVVATTDFPITVEPQENILSLTTPTGNVFLSILPLEAAENVLKSRFLTKVEKEAVTLSETKPGTIVYRVSGEKILNIFNMAQYSIPVVAQVSATTGEILFVEGPEWFRILGFLFT